MRNQFLSFIWVPGPSMVVAGLLMLGTAACAGDTEIVADAGGDVPFDLGWPPDPGLQDEGEPDPGATDDGLVNDVPVTDPGPPKIVPGEPIVADEQVAPSGANPESLASWDSNDLPYLGVSPCGGWGLVFRDVIPRDGGLLESALTYATIGDGGQLVRETLDAREPAEIPIQFGWGLYFDEACMTRVIQAADGGYREWIRDTGDLETPWPSRAATVDMVPALPLALQGSPQSLSHHVLGIDRDRAPHLIFTALMPDSKRRLVHAWRGGATWGAVVITGDGPPPAEWLGFAFGRKKADQSDSRPGVHVLYRTPEGALAYRWFNDDDPWKDPEMIWTPGDGATVPTAGIALASYDTPVVAFTVETRSEAGDLIGSSLHWASRSAKGVWTQELILDRSGAFGGQKLITGYDPRPTVDSEGGLHVVFLDRAYLAHGEGDPWFDDTGSIRYGYRRGSGSWQFATLLSQSPPSKPNDSLRFAMRHPAVATSPNGAVVTVAGMAVELDLKQDRTSLRLTVVPAANAFAP